MRVVVDANVLVSGIFWGGYPSRVLEAWANDRFSIVTSPEILSEYSDVLTDLGSKERQSAIAQHWLGLLVQHTIIVTVHTSVDRCRDPHDNKYLACAVDGAADAIVSGDKDLLTIVAFEKIPIVTPRQFVETVLR